MITDELVKDWLWTLRNQRKGSRESNRTTRVKYDIKSKQEGNFRVAFPSPCTTGCHPVLEIFSIYS